MNWELHLGDCVAGLGSLDDKSVAHAIFDPPFEEAAHSAGRRILKRTWAEKGAGVHHVEQHAISYPPISDAERDAVAAHVARVTRRWILTFCQSEAAHLWRAAYEAAGARYIRTGVYFKTDAQPQYSGDRPGVGWEAIVICHGQPHAGRTRWNGGGKCARWDAAADARFGKSLLVDGQKPLHLMEQLITDFTERGELVIDPYAGAGTTGVACVKLGRRFVGWEVNPKHHQIATDRISQVREQLALPMRAVASEQKALDFGGGG